MHLRAGPALADGLRQRGTCADNANPRTRATPSEYTMHGARRSNGELHESVLQTFQAGSGSTRSFAEFGDIRARACDKDTGPPDDTNGFGAFVPALSACAMPAPDPSETPMGPHSR